MKKKNPYNRPQSDMYTDYANGIYSLWGKENKKFSKERHDDEQIKKQYHLDDEGLQKRKLEGKKIKNRQTAKVIFCLFACVALIILFYVAFVNRAQILEYIGEIINH